ncbi:hypothetical protein [Parvularcula lutaonensis]|uniref:Uncharacterized protein n=1 Tax=Parvularcula lutaonensis TaxID=491923 RepID=A0ABV7MDN9_9PROT|nr:hypothetical protein [Parvularcula lutaonensis]GGY49647.1 hypothetical protein GCM10007148_17830 [Parvularcula lutaonensis]
MAFLFRLLVALVILLALPFHAIVPLVKIIGLFDDRVYEMLVGADPLVTAYVDAAWLPALLLLASTVMLAGAIVGVLKGERWAANLVFLTAVADAASIYFANSMGYTDLPFTILHIVGLGAGIVILWMVVRAVTKPA